MMSEVNQEALKWICVSVSFVSLLLPAVRADRIIRGTNYLGLSLSKPEEVRMTVKHLFFLHSSDLRSDSVRLCMLGRR